MIKYRGYEATVEFDAEDRIFFGRVVGTRDVIAFDGQTVDELEEAFQAVVDEYLADCCEFRIHVSRGLANRDNHLIKIGPSPNSPTHRSNHMKILGIDLGKYNSVACLFDTQTQDTLFFSFKSLASEFSALLSQSQPAQVVIEACAITGWVHDLCQAEGFKIIVANPSQEAWSWKHVKRKTDKDDALKLTKLAAIGQIVPVYIPCAESRQYRHLVNYRKNLVGQVNRTQNKIRALFNQKGISPGLFHSKRWIMC